MTNIYKSILKMFVNKLTMPKDAYLYLKKSKKQQRLNNNEKAIQILLKGTKYFPNNYHLHAQLVNIAMNLKKWELATKQWEDIFRIKKKKVKVHAYIGYAKSLRHSHNLKKAEQILTFGLTHYPANYYIIQELAENLTMQKKWKNAATKWDELFKIKRGSRNLPVRMFIKAAFVYRKVLDYQKAEDILQKGIKIYSNNKKISTSLSNLSIYRRNWGKALERLNYVINLYKNVAPMELYINKAMIKQIIGEHKKANDLYQFVVANFNDQLKNDQKGYRKIILFDNGESRIEFYKNLDKSNGIVITFDSINMIWKNPSFAFKLLNQQKLDIIAIRKKRKQTYQQDLTQHDFYKTINRLIKGYENKFAYGFSLGAYASLYFAPLFNCRILAITPRLSIHPEYGKGNVIPEFEFKHNLHLPYNNKISPIVIYDPKNKLDNTYIMKEVLPAFPHANLIKIPYGGHGMAPHLLKMGVLKDFVLTFVNKEIPKYDRHKKSKSSIYFRLLGKECLNHNKLKWANHLTNQSLEMLPTDIIAIKLKVNILKELEQYDSAIQFIKKTINLIPKNLDIRFLLIDLYLHLNDSQNAKKEVYAAIDTFGNIASLIQKKKDVSERIRETHR